MIPFGIESRMPYKIRPFWIRLDFTVSQTQPTAPFYNILAFDPIKFILILSNLTFRGECNFIQLLLHWFSNFSSRRNSTEQAMNFNELLQERRKMLASYEPKSEETNDPPSKGELPEWMRTRASIFKKSTDTISETKASNTDQVIE